MRILVVSVFYPPHFIGGAELIAHRQARRLVQLGHDVHVFCGEHFAPAPRHQVWNDTFEGVPVTRIRLTGEDTDPRRASHSNPAIDAAFLDCLDRSPPEILHCHNLIGLSVGPLVLARDRSIPSVVTFHDHWGFCLRNTLISKSGLPCHDLAACAECQETFMDRKGSRRPIAERVSYVRNALHGVDRYITPSAYLARAYVNAGFPAERFDVISYGIDPAPAATVAREDSDPVRFTTLCYLGEHKGIHLLLEAFSRLPKHLRWHLDIAGFGHLEPALRRFVARHHLGDRVRFLGRISNEEVPALLANTDVTLLGSLWPENEPVSILESFAHGVPVLSTAVGGVPEMVEHGVNGWLVPPGDVQALCDAIREAISSPEKRLLLASGALIAGTRWPEMRQTQRLVDIYKAAAGQGKRAPAAVALTKG